MAHVCARHKVSDYKAWKKVFDSVKDIRKAGGEKSYQIFHSENDPNDIHLIFEWESFEKAHQFMESPALKDAMMRSGVVEEPSIALVQEYEKGAI